jgi:membrane protein DedA with SNARE-associated domain
MKAVDPRLDVAAISQLVTHPNAIGHGQGKYGARERKGVRVSGLEDAIAQRGGPLIFLSVFLQQIGVPLPAEPTLLIAGSLAARALLPVADIAGAVLGATLVADLAWFVVGRRYGARALRTVFRLSSSPSSQLSRTERFFARWGSITFALAKFIPGLPMAGPVLAGAMGVTIRVFLLYDLLAMTLWAGVFTGLGVVFHPDVHRVIGTVDHAGTWGLIFGAAVLAALALRRWYRVLASPTAALERAQELNEVILSSHGEADVESRVVETCEGHE